MFQVDCKSTTCVEQRIADMACGSYCKVPNLFAISMISVGMHGQGPGTGKDLVAEITFPPVLGGKRDGIFRSGGACLLHCGLKVVLPNGMLRLGCVVMQGKPSSFSDLPLPVIIKANVLNPGLKACACG